MEKNESHDGHNSEPFVALVAGVVRVLMAILHAYLFLFRPEQWKELQRKLSEETAEAESAKSIPPTTRGGNNN